MDTLEIWIHEQDLDKVLSFYTDRDVEKFHYPKCHIYELHIPNDSMYTQRMHLVHTGVILISFYEAQHMYCFHYYDREVGVCSCVIKYNPIFSKAELFEEYLTEQARQQVQLYQLDLLVHDTV